jgi:hypothetical protein
VVSAQHIGEDDLEHCAMRTLPAPASLAGFEVMRGDQSPRAGVGAEVVLFDRPA